ncbi:MAG: hypothetical protein P8Z70_09255, partial [Desulfuromonadales bacterium]
SGKGRRKVLHRAPPENIPGAARGCFCGFPFLLNFNLLLSKVNLIPFERTPMGVGHPYFPHGSDIISEKAVAHSKQGKLEEVPGTQGA